MKRIICTFFAVHILSIHFLMVVGSRSGCIYKLSGDKSHHWKWCRLSEAKKKREVFNASVE